MTRTILLLACLFLGSVAHGGGPAPSNAGRQVYLTVAEALKLAFPGCEVERSTIYLTDEQRERAGELAGKAIEAGVVRPYVATRDGKLVGTAYFDTHTVRTKRQTVMFVVDPAAVLRRIELLAFAEPTEYVPRGKWYAQFVGRKLDGDLELDRAIRGVTGATLTARATTAAARRSLALHAVVFPPPEPPDPPEPGEDEADEPSGDDGQDGDAAENGALR